MTRKRYIHKLWAVALAIHRHPESIFPDGYKVGESLKHIKRFAKNVPVNCGSYEAAWNSPEMKWARDHYIGGAK